MTESSHRHGAPAARSGLDVARALYHRLPPGWLRNQLSCVAYRALYRATITRYRYARGVFTLTTADGVNLKTVRDFDPAPLAALLGGPAVPPGAVVMDLGANIGMVSVYCARRAGPAGRVYAYEPDPRNFEVLVRNLELNGATTVEAVRKGVWSGPGELSFYSGGNYTSSFCRTPYIERDAAHYQVERIPVVALDAEAERLRLTRLDLIKMDIEGGEVQALDGAAGLIQRFHPDLLIDCHVVEQAPTCTEVIRRLRDWGYTSIRASGPADTPTLAATVSRGANA